MAMDLPVGRRRLVGALLILTAVTGLIDAVTSSSDSPWN